MGLDLVTIITFLLYTGSSLARDDWRWEGSGCIGHGTTESHQCCEKAMAIQKCFWQDIFSRDEGEFMPFYKVLLRPHLQRCLQF